MLWSTLQERIQAALIEPEHKARRRPIVYVDSETQLISQLAAGDEILSRFPISTSRFGLGQQRNSYKTPTGIHCIVSKIGQGEPEGRVFKSRQATEKICLPDNHVVDEDVITTRILWLDGLEQGLNRGGDVDYKQRYIYIHGTADER